MPSVSFARESLTESLWNEALPLLWAHWMEVAHFDFELNPDRETYATLNDAGAVRVFTARTDRGLLVGYALFLLQRALHYHQITQAMQDVIYVQPDQRGTMPARFLRFMEAELYAEGVDVICHHGKQAHPQLNRLLDHLGYAPMDVLMVKRRPVLAARDDAPRSATLAEART